MNKNFAIKGHLRRGDEVIKILEMIGGKISYECRYKDGFDSSYFFFINTDENFSIDAITYNSEELKNYYIFTLEEYLEKFPYKVGDKVNYIKYNDVHPDVYTIQGMQWTGVTIEYLLDTSGFSALTKDLQHYKEETMEEKLEQITLDIPNGYEFFGIDDNNKIVLTKKQPQYPKTYEECCKVLFPNTIELGKVSVHGYNGELLTKFGELLICRDAYWKIAGEQMGFGKPWEPDYLNPTKEIRYFIFCTGISIEKGQGLFSSNKILIFPTEEMRDAFYENFKDLIEKCKELL